MYQCDNTYTITTIHSHINSCLKYTLDMKLINIIIMLNLSSQKEVLLDTSTAEQDAGMCTAQRQQETGM